MADPGMWSTTCASMTSSTDKRRVGVMPVRVRAGQRGCKYARRWRSATGVVPMHRPLGGGAQARARASWISGGNSHGCPGGPGQKPDVSTETLGRTLGSARFGHRGSIGGSYAPSVPTRLAVCPLDRVAVVPLPKSTPKRCVCRCVRTNLPRPLVVLSRSQRILYGPGRSYSVFVSCLTGAPICARVIRGRLSPDPSPVSCPVPGVAPVVSRPVSQCPGLWSCRCFSG